MSPLAHRVNGIANQISEELAQLPGKAVQIQVRPTTARDLYLQRVHPSSKERKNRIQQLADVCNNRQSRLAVKAQGLLRHFRNPGNFLLRKVCITHRLVIERWLMP